VQFEDVAAAKQTMRRRILDARAALPPDRVAADANRLAEQVLALAELADAKTVAAYYGIDSEPGTRPLLEALLDSGRRLLLPVVTPDLELDWGVVTGLDALTTARMGLQEPTGPHLGAEAIGEADIVLCPGLAVDVRGARLGRGAGCYDGALQHVDGATPRAILVYDHEVVESVPADRTDQPVTLAVTPTRVLRFGRPPIRPRVVW
jgi:5-formyltetrahydrofolate cyclo-ligase